MAKSNPCLFALCSLTALSLFVAIVVPIVLKDKISSAINNDQILRLENSGKWGQVPGANNATLTKQFYLYDVDTIDGNTVNLKEIPIDLYTEQFNYTELEYAPYSNDSISYYQVYENKYAGKTDDLKNLKIKNVNLATLKADYLLRDLTESNIFVQTLYRVANAFNDDVIPILLTSSIFEFWVKDQKLTNDTAFAYNNTATGKLSDRLYDDPLYGWGSAEGLIHWVKMNRNHITSVRSSIPADDAIAQTLMANFGIDIETINALAGGTSMLGQLISFMNTIYAQQFNCKSPHSGCQDSEFQGNQWFNATVSKQIPFISESYESISHFNATFPVDPEIYAISKKYSGVSFSPDLASSLFSQQAGSLYDVKSVNLLFNSNDMSAIQTKFGLETEKQAEILKEYANYMVYNFTFRGNDFNSITSKSKLDQVAAYLGNLQQTIQDTSAYDLTAIGTYNATKSTSCDDILTAADLSSFSDAVCKSDEYTLDTAAGQTIWIKAYLGGQDSLAWTQIATDTGMTTDNIKALFDTQQTFGGAISEVLNAIAQSLQCQDTPCSSFDLLSQQWAEGTVLQSLPQQYFNFDSSVKSLADIFPSEFTTDAPEFAIFCQRYLSSNTTFPSKNVFEAFQYTGGSILSQFEIYNLFHLYITGNSSALNSTFGIDLATAADLMQYFSHLYYESVMPSLWNTVSAYDLIWGYVDPFLEQLDNAGSWYEGYHPYDANITFVGNESNEEYYDNYFKSSLNSGATHIYQLRTVTEYHGNSTIGYNNTYEDFGEATYKIYENPWNQPGGLKIQGTDSVGFKPNLEEDDHITVFDPILSRDVTFSYTSTSEVSVDGKSYELYKYKLANDQTAVNSVYHTNVNGFFNLTTPRQSPVVVSDPYFNGVSSDLYKNILINGTSISNLTNNLPHSSNFVVEQLTGNTYSYIRTYQFSAEIQNPLIVGQNSTYIPFMTLVVNYTIPQENIATDLDQYQSSLTLGHYLKIIGIISAIVSIILMIVVLITMRNKKQRVSDDTMNPIRGSDVRSNLLTTN